MKTREILELDTSRIFFPTRNLLKFIDSEYYPSTLSTKKDGVRAKMLTHFRKFEQKYMNIIGFGVPKTIESWIFMIFPIFNCFVLHE